MFRRQRTGSVICTSCGVLVGVNDDRCDNCGRRNPGLWGWAPAFRALGHDLGFVPFVIGTCIVVYGLMLLVSVRLPDEAGPGGMLTLGSPSFAAMMLFGASGSFPIFYGDRWWTVLSASWLHGGLIHIFFNLFAVRQLAPAIADLYGPGRMVIIYVAAGMVGFTLSSLAGQFLPALPLLHGAQVTVGASASISGLIGAILAYGHRSGSGIARSYAMSNVVMLLVMGFLFPIIDNYAHLGGFGGGYLAARVLDPLKPERIDHLAIAVCLLAASVLSVAVSVIHGLSF